MNTYRASYRETWAYGGYEDKECIVVANTEQEALGLVLEEEPKTNTKDWEITPIDTTKTGVLLTYERCC